MTAAFAQPEQHTGPDGATSVTLRPDVGAPRAARRVVREACREACDRGSLPAHLVDDASFVASELVVNSIRQARGPLSMHVLVRDGGLTVRVDDAAAVGPSTGVGGPGASRSWDVVKRLSNSYGYRCDGHGRQVWATLRTPTRPGTLYAGT